MSDLPPQAFVPVNTTLFDSISEYSTVISVDEPSHVLYVCNLCPTVALIIFFPVMFFAFRLYFAAFCGNYYYICCRVGYIS